MSGIFGYYDPHNELPADIGQRMAGALAMTDSAHYAIKQTEKACIGVVDKGIFSGASQILHDERTGRFAVIQGEIVGFQGERDDCTPADRARDLLCQPLSEERLSRAIGPFSAAILDANTQAIELTGDRYGWYLTYYSYVGNAVIFAGQCKALLASGQVSDEIDLDAQALMLALGEVTGDLTLFKAIKALPAAALVHIDDRGMNLRKYWWYAFEEDHSLDFKDTARRCGELMHLAVERICRPHEKIGVPLSGGLDSRIALASVPQPDRVPSFTWGLADCRDLRYAKQAADALGSPHHGYVYDPAYIAEFGPRGTWLTEGLSDLTDMHVLPYVQTVREFVPVILDGMAGDAILGGNFINKDWWRTRSTEQAAAALWQWRFKFLPPEIGRPLLGAERYEEVVERARSCFCDQFASYAAETEMDRAMAFLLDNRCRRCAVSGTHLFRWQIEAHYPFYDNDFFDLVMSTPYAWRHRHRLYVEMIRQCYPKMADIPWQRTNLPAGSRWPARFVSAAIHRLNDQACRRWGRPDRFADRHVARFDDWLRGPLHDYIHNILLSPSTGGRGLFRSDGLRLLLDRHQQGADLRKVIGIVGGMELFYRLFVDDFDAACGQFCRPIKT